MSDLAGKLALVTGASRGIGLATARALARQHAALVLVGRGDGSLLAAREECLRLGAPHADAVVADLLDRIELERLARGSCSRVDVLVNNAGSAPSAPLERTDDKAWDTTLALNAYAPFALCRAALPGMLARGYGRIVNLASTAALQGFAYTSAYTASKHALLGLTRALAAEVAQRAPQADVTLNAVCPGFVDTAIVAESVQRLVRSTGCSEAEARARLASMNAGGRLFTADEVAAAVVALVLESPGKTRGAAVEL